MNMVLPPPDQVRAIVVGIERYPGLGQQFDIHGAVVGAMAFARWLVDERQVPPAGIEMWLSLSDGTSPAEVCKNSGLGDAVVHDFTWAAFRKAMSEPQGAFADGRFLMVYFCGHGVVSGARNDQHLVQPDATVNQFQCFEAQNWRELFRGSGWQRYGHQLWIFDACRNQWGAGLKVLADQWNAGKPSDVRQCAMFACSNGGAAGIDTKLGPLFTRQLLDALRTDATDVPGWPAFDLALRATAEKLRADPRAAQNATISIGEDWYGSSMVGEGLAGRNLEQLLSDLAWPYKRFEPYVMGAQSLTSVGFAAPADLNSALAQLHELAPVSGVPPVVDFAERVGRAAPSAELQAWVRAQLSNQSWAELDERFAANSGSVRLSLWYRDDDAQPCIEAELEVLHAGRGVRPWQRPKAKPVTRDTVGETIGHWMQAVYTHLGDPPPNLVVELYLPRELLTAMAYDTATVPMEAGEKLRFGEDLAALLRCTDRYKGKMKKLRWRKYAPQILARLQQRTADPLHWASSADDAPGLKDAFLAPAHNAPVWLGFEPAACGGDAPLGVALEEGLPAVVWLHAGSGAESMHALRAGLQDLLKTPLEQLPARLLDWRAGFGSGAGQAMSLLLDDPAREPALLTSWTQPVG